MMYVLAQVSPGVLGWVWAESRTCLYWELGRQPWLGWTGGPGDSLGTEDCL